LEVTDDWAEKMVGSHVDMQRYGGELKAQLDQEPDFSRHISL